MIAGDTSAISHFLRRLNDQHDLIAEAVEKLIESNELALFGIVRQELLSGIRQKSHFESLELTTGALPMFFAEKEDHTLAAQFFNACRTKGIQGSPIDFLVCAMAVRRKFQIFTTDPDFELYLPVIPIELYQK